MITLEEKLRLELRTCPRCHYKISSPFAERCPRCLADVPVNDHGCNKCVHNSGCPASSARKVESMPA